MRIKSALLCFRKGLIYAFFSRKKMLPAVCCAALEEALEERKLLLPDGTCWICENRITVYLNKDDYGRLGGLTDILRRRLEAYMSDYVKKASISNIYGRLEIRLRCRPEVRVGDVYVELDEDFSMPPLDIALEVGTADKIYTVCIDDPESMWTQPLDSEFGYTGDAGK